MSLLTITAKSTYKGHIIERTESPIQIFYVVDEDRGNAYWSLADARRAINGQILKSCPVDIKHI